jgi:TonB family protein
MRNLRKLVVAAIVALVTTPSLLSAHSDAVAGSPAPADSAMILFENEPLPDPAESAPLLSIEKSGTIPTKQGLRVRVNTDPGNVHIFTNESAQVTYSVRVEADSREPGAEQFLGEFKVSAQKFPWGVSLEGTLPWKDFGGRFRVVYEIHVPRRSNVEVHTNGGNIELQDIEGYADLFTEGGNITAGSVDAGPAPSRSLAGAAGRMAAKLETLGGHIAVGDVNGTLRATTSGGHITTGDIKGDGILHTGGGLIRTGRISGAATLDTGGGNIHVESAASNVTADTAGGEIEFGETSGTIRARTEGGSVRIAHVSGPTSVETSGGIFLGQVDAPLRVSSHSGNVTARLADSSGQAASDAGGNTKNSRKLPPISQLSSSGGDIVLYIPREMAATIDAVVGRGDGHRIIADASLPLRVSYQDSDVGPHTIHCEGKLNGGGEVFHLRAMSGNIILKLATPRPEISAAPPHRRMGDGDTSPVLQAVTSDEPGDDIDAAGFFAEIRRRILESWWGGVPVDAAEMQKRLEHSVAPVYPEVARQAGIEGDVVLRINVSGEGRVTDLAVLEGPPILARAAMAAVRQWKYRAWRMNGSPAAVVTTMVVSFRLH